MNLTEEHLTDDYMFRQLIGRTPVPLTHSEKALVSRVLWILRNEAGLLFGNGTIFTYHGIQATPNTLPLRTQESDTDAPTSFTFSEETCT